ncbi:glutamate racemase [Tenuibacillus multivorans]|uniref:Glutamate racemase n=1 Tax=Tenuibacillus multivorans TaxID=237069 RepID=A0A1G9ZP24_9BACI|nr:glutamate racemase [Tenuibacillus multivorans]GEL76798.1 glutamate racemase [Tenuibacillus multivorans]SDN23108.1 glutamate racemase [Tenuibacillus multivorans]
MNRPIGVIDSGVGGLTVLHELNRQLPTEKFIYLGDTLRCPYGPKEEIDVQQYTWEMVHYLMKFEIKMLVIACNTATALVLEQLKDNLPIPVIGVIESGARAAIKATQTNQVGIIGTENTIQSEAYERALKRIKPHINTLGVACPNFVPMIENGDFVSLNAKRIVEGSLQFMNHHPRIDTLILGCTHYPIIQPLIEEVIGENVTVLSSAVETGFEVSTVLTFYELFNTNQQENQEPLIFTTGSLQVFQRLKEEIFQLKSATLKQVSLT